MKSAYFPFIIFGLFLSLIIGVGSILAFVFLGGISLKEISIFFFPSILLFGFFYSIVKEKSFKRKMRRRMKI